MESIKIFSDIMELIATLNQMLQGYNNTPRHYGTDDLLYQSEAHLIQHIGEEPELSLNELANRTYRTKSATSMMLQKLTQRKLVLRKRDETDRRKYILTLTPLGQEIFDYHRKLDSYNYELVLQEISKTQIFTTNQLETTSSFLKVLIETLKTPTLKTQRKRPLRK